MALYARFEYDGRHNYGIVNNGVVDELRNGLFEDHEPSGRQFPLDDVKLLRNSLMSIFRMEPCVPPLIAWPCMVKFALPAHCPLPSCRLAFGIRSPNCGLERKLAALIFAGARPDNASR